MPKSHPAIHCPRCHRLDPDGRVAEWTAGNWSEGKTACGRCQMYAMTAGKRRLDGFEEWRVSRLGVERLDRFTVLLHIGFIAVEETAEQLERLRNEPEYKPRSSGTQGPAIEKSAVVLRPIDATAARVTGIGG